MTSLDNDRPEDREALLVALRAAGLDAFLYGTGGATTTSPSPSTGTYTSPRQRRTARATCASLDTQEPSSLTRPACRAATCR
jgi:hypothetical protein